MSAFNHMLPSSVSRTVNWLGALYNRYARLRTTSQVVIHGDRKDRLPHRNGGDLFSRAPFMNGKISAGASLMHATVPDRRRGGGREKSTSLAQRRPGLTPQLEQRATLTNASTLQLQWLEGVEL